jgi:histone-lysine N-methyltransferase SETMAR
MVTVNKELYIDTFSHLRDAVRRKCPENWRTNSWFLLHDSAPAQWSVLVKQFLAKNNVRTLQHPPYSPDMAAADFYLFPRLKSALMRQHCCAATYIIKNPMEELICCYKMAIGYVSNTFTVLAEVYNCTRGSF